MQAALPIRVSDRIADWRAPLQMALQRLFEIKPRLLVLQFGGAVGTLEKFGDKGREVAAHLAIDLKLGLPQKSWHTDRSTIAEFAGWLSLVSGALAKLARTLPCSRKMKFPKSASPERRLVSDAAQAKPGKSGSAGYAGPF